MAVIGEAFMPGKVLIYGGSGGMGAATARLLQADIAWARRKQHEPHVIRASFEGCGHGLGGSDSADFDPRRHVRFPFVLQREPAAHCRAIAAWISTVERREIIADCTMRRLSLSS